MAETYEDYGFRRLRRWARGKWADLWHGTIFGFFDLIKDAAFEATKAGLVLYAPTDAVERHGRSRMLVKLSDSFESIEAFRQRVKKAWDFWPTVTGTSGLRACLVLHGEDRYIGLEVLDIANDDWLGGFVNGAWGEDENYDNWSRATIVIPQPHPWGIPVVGTGTTCSPGTMCGITMTGNELSTIRRAFRDHRPAHIVGIDIDVLMGSTAVGDYLADHGVTNSVVRLPLHIMMAGYSDHNAQCGVAVCGQEFT